MPKTPKPKPISNHSFPKWPWATMEVGEFFFSPRERNTMFALAYTTGKKLGRKFSTRMCYCLKGVNGDWRLAESLSRATYGVGIWRDK